MLYLVEYADWDSQAKIGHGGSNSGIVNNGASDNMTYHTGTMQADRTTKGTGCQYRHIEDWWGNVYDWVDGIVFRKGSSANIYCYKNPANFRDDEIGGTIVGERTTSSGVITAWNEPTVQGFEYALYPINVGGTDSTYVTDQTDNSSASGSNFALCVGQGPYDSANKGGAFQLNGSYLYDYSSGVIGCRLMKLP